MARKPQAGKPVSPRYAAAPAAGKTVWLTFDDGPHAKYTAQILEVLSAHGVPALFFAIGKNAAVYPSLIRRIKREGHRIGNHTYRHPDLTKLTSAKIREEINLTENQLGDALGSRKLFRPPYGAHNAKVDAIVAELGYRTILWNVDTVDWSPKFKPDKWVDHGLQQIRARTSSVVLNHDIQKTTAEHLDTFIRRIKAIKNTKFGNPASL